MDLIGRNDIFEATFNDERHRFRKTEHANVGDGWFCRRLDWKHGERDPIVHESKLTDPVIMEKAA